jgi:hypothetical protein
MPTCGNVIKAPKPIQYAETDYDAETLTEDFAAITNGALIWIRNHDLPVIHGSWSVGWLSRLSRPRGGYLKSHWRSTWQVDKRFTAANPGSSSLNQECDLTSSSVASLDSRPQNLLARHDTRDEKRSGRSARD